MDIESAFERFVDDYLEFDRVENPAHARPDICAFIALDRLLPGTRDIVTASEHDVIYLDADCEKLGEVATDADIILLARCGVLFDSETDSLAMFT